MTQSDWFMIVPSPAGSALLWGGLVVVLCYFAREPVHRLLRAACLSLRHACRVLSRTTHKAAAYCRRWSRHLLLLQTRADSREAILLDFNRLQRQMQRDFAGLPLLKERLARQISFMEEDFQRSADVPPEPPAWARVSQAMSDGGDDHTGQLARALEDIRDSLAQYRSDAREEIRRSSHRRYLLLYRMMPRWRRVEAVLGDFDHRLERVEQRITQLRRREHGLRSQADSGRGARVGALAIATVGRFVLALVALAVVAYGISVHTAMLQEPLGLVLGEQPLLNGVAATGVMIGLLVVFQLGLGLLVFESAGLSRVIPAIGTMDIRQRRLLFWFSLVPLMLLSFTVAAIYLRLATADLLATNLLLSADLVELRLMQAAIYGLALALLPLALAAGAIPLGTLLRSARPAGVLLLASVLTVFAFILRGLITAIAIVERLSIQVYDLVIFLPLWIEGYLRSRRTALGRDDEAGQPVADAHLAGPRAEPIAHPFRERA